MLAEWAMDHDLDLDPSPLFLADVAAWLRVNPGMFYPCARLVRDIAQTLCAGQTDAGR